MATQRSRTSDALLAEGRITRSQSAHQGGAAAPGEGGKGCGSGGRRGPGAKKRPALVDVTNAGGAGGVRPAGARPKPVVADAPEFLDADSSAAGGTIMTRRRAASMDKMTDAPLGDLRADGGAALMDMDGLVDCAMPGGLHPHAPLAAAAPPLATGHGLHAGGAALLLGGPGAALGGAVLLPPALAQPFVGGGDAVGVWKDVDAPHGEDPLFCCAYVQDIYANLRLAERKHRPSTVYMDSVQTDINATMRGILVDWLVEVAEEYKLVPDTLFLSVAYIDRCLSTQVVQRAQLQLVGVTCMLIAAKYEEIYAPQVDEFCYITDNTYTRDQVLDMERQVLALLSFELTQPTCKSFLRRFLRAAEADHKAEFLACFLAELSLLDYAFLRHLPSCVAASCVLVSLWTLRRPAWSATLAHYTGYHPAQLKECATQLVELFAGAKKQTLPAVREKYSQHKFKCVSSLVPPDGGLPDSLWLA